MAAPRLFLIDGSNQMYRAYHALPPMTNASGQVTHAVYGFVTMLLKLIADHKPEFIAASFDLAGPTFRRDLAADYKATRSPMPTDLIDQVPLVHQACRALGVPILTTDRYEADDVMGTLARQAAERGFEVALVTGDKDFFQLVGGPIKVYNPRDPGTWFDADGVKQKFGVPPEQVIDVLALMGDTSDNVKGVPGIGEKGARDLITTFGSLEAPAGACGRGDAEALSGSAARPRRGCAAEPGAGHDPHRLPGDVRSRRLPLHRRHPRRRVQAVHASWRSARSSRSTRRRRTR